VHHCNSWRIKDQLDVTCYFISLLMCSTCFGHCASACNMGATQNPATPNLPKHNELRTRRLMW
jgi:hypothetical protein